MARIKVKGYVQAGITQLKDLRKGENALREADRNTASARIDDAKKRRLTKEQQRLHDKEIMAKSLVNYPKNPITPKGAWEYKGAPKSEAGKPKTSKSKDVHPKVAHANRKATQVAARKLAKEEKKAQRLEARRIKQEAKAQRIAERQAKRAEKAQGREARKAERAEQRRLASLPPVKVTDAMLDAVMEVVVLQYSMSEAEAKRQRAYLGRLAKASLSKQAKRSRQLAIRLSISQGLKMEIDATMKTAK